MAADKRPMNGARPGTGGQSRAVAWPGPTALKQLRYFLAVLRAGSLTGAEHTLHAAQPAIGEQIRQLEESLGVELLIRHSRGVTPTGAGDVLAEHAERIVGKAERMRLDIMDMGGAPRGRIALGLTGMAVPMIWTRLADACRREAPDVRLTVAEAASHRLADWLAQGRLDMAVTGHPPPTGGAVSEALAAMPLYFVAAPGHPLAKGAEIALRAALEADLVLPPKPSGVRGRIAGAARSIDAALRPVWETESVTAIGEMARHGLACTIMPHGAVARDIAAGSVVALRIVEPEVTADFYLTCSQSRAGTRAVRAVRREIRALVTGPARSGAADPAPHPQAG